MANDTYTVERSITIARPPEPIYELLVDFHNWPKWSPWEDLDPQLQRSYSGAEAGTGSVYRWSGNRKAGQGQMTIVEATKPSEVRIDLVFEKPFKGRNDTSFRMVPDGEATHVHWSMTGNHSFATKVMGVFKSMDKMIGPDFEKGLDQLKRAVEATSRG